MEGTDRNFLPSTFRLYTRNKLLGVLTVTRNDGTHVHADFVPFPPFEAYRPLFEDGQAPMTDIDPESSVPSTIMDMGLRLVDRSGRSVGLCLISLRGRKARWHVASVKPDRR